MLYRVYAIYDSKMECYNLPMFMRAHGEMLRTFADLSVDMNTWIGKAPGDYTLFYIGEYDDMSGVITMLQSKVNLGTALEHRPSSGFDGAGARAEVENGSLDDPRRFATVVEGDLVDGPE